MSMNTKKPLPNSINIVARRWFDKINGNTYFSGEIWTDGKIVLTMPFQYGYGDQWEYEARKCLNDAGIIQEEVYMRKCSDETEYTQGYKGYIREYCEENGITLYKTVSDVKRKKDM